MNPYRFSFSAMIRALTAACVVIAFFSAGAAAQDPAVDELREFEYWDNGAVRLCTLYDIKGHVTAKVFCRPDGTTERTERYDTFGNRVEEALYDTDGKLRPGVDGVAVRRRWYHAHQIVAQISYDHTGHPIEKKVYSEEGNLVLRQYVDGEHFGMNESVDMTLRLGPRNVAYSDKKRAVDKFGY